MGVSESRMRKLMEGAGKGLRGVAAKVGALVRAITGGEWCEQQGSLMRGLAFGILDPQGDRYRHALSHSEACPACRAYVLSLRGLAVVLPPVPALLYPILATGATGVAATGALAGSGSAGAGAGGGAGVTSAPLGAGAGVGTLSASSAAGAGAASGGWWLAGGVGAKLAAGCLLALGVGAGCVALEGSPTAGDGAGHARTRTGAGSPRGVPARGSAVAATRAAAPLPIERAPPSTSAARTAGDVSSAVSATREFGPERPALASATGTRRRVSAAAPADRVPAPVAQSASSGYTAPARTVERPARASASSASSAGYAAAEREFAPG
jgi:hypothetical protein